MNGMFLLIYKFFILNFDFNFEGLLIGAATFVCIGLFHPLVIKGEYYFGVKCWFVFLAMGIAGMVGSILVDNQIVSIILGVFAFSSFWGIGEVFEQRKRVEKGWFPRNPKRKNDR